MIDTTVIYYTSNRENEAFENNIRKTLLETIGDLPLISVSQKPIDFGKNICVGDIGVSSQNAYRQLQIGAMKADTKFISPAEADFLYPKQYFEYEPQKDDTIYRAMPLYVLFAQRGKAFVYCMKPRGSEACCIVGRKCLIDALEFMLSKHGKFGMADANDFPYLLRVVKPETFQMPVSAISFKTDQNMHRKTPYSIETKTRHLPHWGNAKTLVQKYMP